MLNLFSLIRPVQKATRPLAALGLLLATAGAAHAQLGALTNYPFSGGATGVSLADINGDGRPDLVSATSNNPSAVVLLNTSAPGALPATFAAANVFPVTLSTGYFTSSATGDVNGDGKPDIVAGNPNGNSAVVWLNTTAPNATTATFGAGTSFSLPIIPNGVALADLNGDGKAELVASGNVQSTAAPQLVVLLSTTAAGSSTPSFGAAATFAGASGGRLQALALGDLNGDGKLDVAAVDNFKGGADVLLNTTATGATTVSFAPVAFFATAANTYGIALADFNNDNSADIVTSNGLNGGNVTAVLLNTTAANATTPSFGPVATATTGGTYSYAVAAGDLNRDSKPDAVVLNGNGGAGGNVGVVLNNTAPGATTASLSPAVAYGGIANPNAVAVGDLNGDGKPDVAVTNGNGLGVLINQYGTPTLTALSPGTGPVGTTVIITGSNFAAGTTVAFNGTAATSVAVNGTTQLTVVVPAGATTGNVVATTANGASNGLPFTIATTFTAAPALTAPANGSATNNPKPTYGGTAPAGSTVTVYVDGLSIGTTTATASGAFALTQPTALAAGSHSVYATAQSSGVAVSPNSATNTFSIDTTAPTVTLTSSTASSFGSSASSQFNYTATFSESVLNFAASGLTITNGTLVAGSLAGSGTTYTFSVSPTSAGGYTTVTVVANAAQDAAGNGSTASNTYYIQYTLAAVTWTGAVSTDWKTPGNWNPAAVPGATSVTVTIPAGTPNQPVAAGNVYASNLTVAAGASLTLAGGSTPGILILGSGGGFFSTASPGTLTLGSGSTLAQGAGSQLYINNDFVNNGATFALDAASLINFGNTTGSVTHQLRGTAGLTCPTLTVGNQGASDILSIQVPVSVRQLVQVLNTSTVNVGTGGSLTLLSDALGTALIVNTSGTVNGPVTMQRYIDGSLNAGLGYRHFSTPVTGATVASLASATNGFTPILTQSYNTSATPGTTTPFPNVFAYDQSRLATVSSNYSAFDKGFVVPADATTALAAGQGYAVNIAAGQAVSFTGTPFTGNLSQTLSRGAGPDAGWQLVGNPYPAPLDFSQVAPAQRAGLDAAVYVVQSTGQYVGGYRAYVNGQSTTGTNNPLIASGQGFFVRVSTGQPSGTLTFTNVHRVTSYASQQAFQRTTADTRPSVRLELAGAGLADGFVTYAEAGATAGFDGEYDAAKLANSTGLNLSSATTGEPLAIDGRPAFTATTVLALNVGVPAAGTYTLGAAAISNLPAGLDAYLRDAATGQTTRLAAGSSYRFSVSASEATALLTGRFTLQFNSASPLATAPGLSTAAVSVYPNPARERFTVLVPAVAGASQVQAELLNTLGQVVRHQSAALPGAGATLSVETAGLSAGVYTLRLTAGASTLAQRIVLY